MGTIVHISRSALAVIRACAEASPDEVCGLLLGWFHRAGSERRRGDEVEVAEVVACANVHPTPATHFELDPAALLAAHRAARGGAPAVVGHYHSHPSGDAAPSATDASLAPPDGATWLIVAGGDVTAWRAVHDGRWHGRFDPVAIVSGAGCAAESAVP